MADEIELPKEKIREILFDSASKSLAGNIPIFGKLLGAIERVNQEVKEEKLKILLKGFQERFDSTEEALNQIQFLFESKSGIILFQKVLHIIDNETLDKEWIDLLGSVLKNISDTEIEKQFEEYSFILSQIARLSPQALLILSKYEQWQSVRFTGTTTSSRKTTVGDWDRQVANYFANATAITDKNVIERISHTFHELESARMVRITATKCLECTQIGESIKGTLE